jgi:ATP-binding cassette subfamily F protein 3
LYYVRDISVRFGERTLLNDISFMITPKDRIGLIGRNGAGKSTLLKIIAGQQSPDSGILEFPSKTTIGYLKQEFELNETLTLLDEAMTCHAEAKEIQHKLDALQEEMAERTDYESEGYHQLLEDMAHLTGQLEHFNLSALEIDTTKVLKGLGFAETDFQKPVSTFSGGWKMRIELAKLLLRRPDLLMLDEPTNHLDIESIIWLENYLNEYTGTVIVISHDIQFLDNVCNRIIEVTNGKVSDYRLRYSKYLEEKEKQSAILQSAFENQQKEIAQKEKTINRFMAKATKTKMAQSMQKQLDKVDRIEVPTDTGKVMQIRFAEVPRSGRDVVRTHQVSKSFGEKKVFSNIDLIIERGERVAFVGQNGQGKTTMAKIIAGLLPASSGEVVQGSNMHLSYYAQNQSELLDLKSTVLQVMQDKAPEEQRLKVRSILGAFLFSGDDADKKVSVLSGGERARLAMASLIMKPCNFLILDEPTNHLDIYSKEILKKALKDYTGTLLVISHDREFLAGLTDKVVEFRDGRTYEYIGDIDYFLDKRKMDNMRSVELQKSVHLQNEVTSVSKKPEGEELRRLRKQVQQLEKEIAKIEGEMEVLAARLADSEFYKDAGFADAHRQYTTLSEHLERKMEAWEDAAAALDS